MRCHSSQLRAILQSSTFRVRSHLITDPARRCLRAMASSTGGPAPLIAGETFFLDSFALRQWEAGYAGTRVSFDRAAFVARVHEYYGEGRPLAEGYAPFCKHLFVPNFVGATVGALPITDGNRHLLRSGYTSRRPEELAVLTR